MSEATIVLPAYNAGETIRQAIETAVATGFPVICADDGSDDDTADVAEACGATVLRLPHQGLPATVNAAWEAAESPWCYFTASDDWIDVDAVSSLLDALAREHGGGENLAFVYSDLAIHDRFGEPRGVVWGYQQVSGDVIAQHYRQAGQAPIPSSGGCMWRREVLERVGGFKADICADTDLLSRVVTMMGFAFKALHVPGARYHYRWGPERVMSRRKAEVTVEIMRRHGSGPDDFLRKWYAWGCSEDAEPFREASGR